jgi:hypothetical protein
MTRFSKLKPFLKPFGIVFVIYVFGALALLAAGSNYLDDNNRNTYGGHDYAELFGRYVSHGLSTLLTGNAAMDLSPATQVVALALLAAASVILVYVLCNKEPKKLTWGRLLATVPLGLSPWFLQCLSFKYDSIFMALSVLAVITPFLFFGDRKRFILASVVGLGVALTTYQTSTSIYILMALALAFRDWMDDKKMKDILVDFGLPVGIWVVILGLFSLLVKTDSVDYINTSVLPLREMIPGVLNNIKTFLGKLWLGSAVIWRALYVVVGFWFVISQVVKSQRKALTALIASGVLAVALIASFGAYSVMVAPDFNLRFLYGFGAFLAILLVLSSRTLPKLSVVPAVCISGSFIVFALVYGNALKAQDAYVDFRTDLVLADLSEAAGSERSQIKRVFVEGDIGLAPTLKQEVARYPVLNQLLFSYLSQENWLVPTLFIARGWEQIKYTYPDNVYDKSAMAKMIDTYYHAIYSDGESYVIELYR